MARSVVLHALRTSGWSLLIKRTADASATLGTQGGVWGFQATSVARIPGLKTRDLGHPICYLVRANSTFMASVLFPATCKSCSVLEGQKYRWRLFPAIEISLRK
jgi:hypothetical protein